ncbi:MAG: YcaO-related McrA-glycine thioamidation protein [Euryarchaeota archaeon]|jgi:putative methanogenesis marker protein 1|nr:YcaO-related McrA-glycine thioamidation protein [Euryarchaeota archaeon]HNS25877.1 YcaO-related McrA-glycine thioamidation protein [Methanobacteriaceae archaeon]
MFREIPVTYFGCTHRAVNPEETIIRVEKKLKYAGVTRIADITHLDRVGIPVYSAIRPGAAEGAVSVYAGKGATKIQAKASAMMEAFERYSAEFQDSDKDNVVSQLYEPGECVDPNSLIIPYRTSDPRSEKIEWITALDARTDKKSLIPANAVYHPYHPQRGVHLFKSNTNGLASGNVLEEAVFHGLMEVVERDAWSIFEARKKHKKEVICDKTENKLINTILTKFREKGVDIKLVDLTADIKITTIAAVADDKVLKDPALLTMGVGTHLDPEIAVIRALTEVAQSRATQIHGTREDTTRAIFMRKAGYERMKRINKHWFGDYKEKIKLSQLKNKSTTSFKDDLEISLDELKKVGIEQIFYVDITRPEIDIPVVRVIIPGLEVYAVDPERMGRRIMDKEIS